MSTAAMSIGVFDSGMGGLTVLRAMRDLLPYESFIYLGDTARLPYGTKSPDTIKLYAMQMAKLLIERNIKALVIACNTATTAALSHLQEMLPDIPVIGVVSPGAGAAIEATENRQIFVLATETTIASNAYQNLIKKALPDSVIKTNACSLLVALAEEGMVSNQIAREVLKYYLSDFQEEDTLLLACTHFPVFRNLMAEMLPKGVRIVDSAQSTATALKDLLKARDLLNLGAEPGSIQYLATDSVRRFSHLAGIFLGTPLTASDVELI